MPSNNGTRRSKRDKSQSGNTQKLDKKHSPASRVAGGKVTNGVGSSSSAAGSDSPDENVPLNSIVKGGPASATEETSKSNLMPSPPPKKRWKKSNAAAAASSASASVASTKDAVQGLMSLPTSPAPATPMSLRATLTSFAPNSAAKQSLFSGQGMTPLTTNSQNSDMFSGLVFSPGALVDLGLEPGTTPIKQNPKENGGFEAFYTELSPIPQHQTIPSQSYLSSYPDSPHAVGSTLLSAPHLQSPPFLSSPDTIKKRRLMSPSWVTIQLGNGDENENFKRVNEEMRKDITRISAGNGKAGKVVDIRDIERRGGKKKNGGGSRQQNMGAQQNQCLDMANYPHPNFSHPNPSTGKAKKKIVCNCKKSKCLKLYCECFTALEYCDGCNCIECRNTPEHEAARAEAIRATKAKNANAFRQKISSGNVVNSTHAMGCRCKKSFCLKKYCECYEAGVFCGEKCRCNQCANFIGSHKLIERRKKIKDTLGVQRAEAAAANAIQAPPHAPVPMEALSPTPLELAAVAKLAAEGMGDGGNLTNLNEELSLEATDEFADAASTAALAAQISSSLEPPPSTTSTSSASATTLSSTISSSSTTSSSSTKSKTRSFKTSLRNRKKDPKDLVITHIFGPNRPTMQGTNFKIFKCLGNDDLFNAGIVSKGFKEVAFDEKLWSL